MRSRTIRRSFTLIEVLISLAIAAILILGVNAIFAAASQTVGAGQAVSTAARDARAAYSVFQHDFQSAVTDDAPFLILRSQPQLAFRDRNHEAAGIAYPHRVDQLSFFARGHFPRQTGNPDQVIAPMSSSEALIWYGHLLMPDFTSPLVTPGRYQHRHPGEIPFPPGRNDENFYARDWALGRMVMLLRMPDSDGLIRDDYGQPQLFIGRGSTAGPASLSPLAVGSQATWMQYDFIPSTSPRIQWSYHDLAATSIDDFRQRIIDLPAPDGWWNRFTYRFQGYPYPSRPLTPAGMARTVPVFLTRCSNFMVEFAGDFLDQDPETGEILGVYWDHDSQTIRPTDNRIDFYIDDAGIRRIQWYGYPRGDVVPLFQRWREAPGEFPNSAAPFERPPPPDIDAYLCAWGPDSVLDRRPALIRITLSLEDANNRLSEPRTFEYILKLP